MLRFFLIFLAIQLTMFGLNLLSWVQQHIVLPWTSFLAHICASLVTCPSSWRQKLVGLLAGFVAVQAINVLRVISLFYLGQWSTTAFNFAHEYLWQALIMLDVLVFWLLWVRWSGRRSPSQDGGGAEPPLPPAAVAA
jgi:exosortase/archaeosortase family protein